MQEHTVETIDITPTIHVRIVVDPDPTSPTEWSNLGQITYASRSRYVLGTEAVSDDRFEEIGRRIDKGELIGLPVYAYVHSGSTISTTPYSCPWDSGRSGWAYCTREAALSEAGLQIVTAKVRKQTLERLAAEVDTFAEYLRGEVYAYIVELHEDGDFRAELDACWGIYGLDYAKEEGKRQGEWYAKEYAAQAAKESAERTYWAERDVMTTGSAA